VNDNQVKSSQVYLYSAFHNIDCIKAASLYQSKNNNNVHFLVEKHPCLVELIIGITDWLIHLNIPNEQAKGNSGKETKNSIK